MKSPLLIYRASEDTVQALINRILEVTEGR